MKKRIGLFGDSYCELHATNSASWPSLLANKYNFEVTNHGQRASGILWSYRKLEKYANHYDHVIWCVSSAQRFTLPMSIIPGELFYTGPGYVIPKNLQTAEVQRIVDIADKFLIETNVLPDLALAQEKLVLSALTTWPHLTIIPCFNGPLNIKSCLHDIHIKELAKMTDLTSEYVSNNYYDMRSCHLSDENNQVLAEVILENYQSNSIVDLDLNRFTVDHIKPNLEKYFRKR